MRRTVFTLISAAFMAACGTGPGTSVAIKFGTAGGAASPSSAAMFSVAGGQVAQQAGHIVSGSNGELNISGIWVLVEEFELEPVETSDCDDSTSSNDCADFELEYFFIDVPLDGTTITVVTADIPVGSYDELEFEVDDIEVDPNDPEEVAEADLINALWQTVHDQFPNWPDKASMLVMGSWTPTGGSSVDFATYFDADIEVEIDLLTPYVVTAEATDGDISIYLHPDLWFKRTDGTVWNLKDLKGQLVDFDLEIEDGFELKID